MPTPPDRFREPATPDEHLKAVQAERRGEQFRIESDEYRRYRADALRAAGLTDEADASEPDTRDLGELTPEDHLEQIRGR